MDDQGLRLLIVDDDPVQRKDLAEGLDHFLDLGVVATMDTAGGEDEALARVREADGRYDIIILDLRMDHRDSGLRVLKTLKGDSRCENTEFLVLTVIEADAVRDEVNRLGADLYLEKSFSYPPIALIRERLHRLSDRVRIRGLEQELARLTGEPRPGIPHSLRAFAALPYHDGFRDVSYWIEHVAQQSDVTTIRADRRPEATELARGVFNDIRTSLFFVCDVSDANPNVLLELGLALALKELQPERKLIILAEKDAELPIDIQGYVVSRYNRLSLHETLVPKLERFFSAEASRSPE